MRPINRKKTWPRWFWPGAMICLGVVLASSPYSAQRGADSWKMLKHRTGWVDVAVVDVNLYDDMLVIQPLIAREDTPSEHKFRLPRPGDVVVALQPLPLLISDFKTEGEQQRFVPPLRSRGLGRYETGIVIAKGTRLRVVEYAREPPIENGLQSVYARVVPTE